jgi:methyl-accepting chemotaxis protein
MRLLGRRTTLFIARRFQIRYISWIMALMSATALITGYVVYVTTWSMLGEKLADVYPQGFLMDIMSGVNFVLIFRLLCLSPIVMLIGLILSNRIAGPLYRINRFLRKISAGNYSSRLEIRLGDELQDLALSVNHLVSSLRSDTRRRNEIVGEISETVKGIEFMLEKGSGDKQGIADGMARLRELIKRMK